MVDESRPLTMDDAVVNDLMRSVVALSHTVSVAPASLYPAYADLLAGGFVMFDDELRFSSDARKRRPDPRQPVAYYEWEENDFHIDANLDFDDPAWRVQILLTALDIVQKLLPQAAAIARYPVQAIIFLNPDPDDPIADEGYACGGVKFHQLHPSNPFDQRLDLEGDQPAAVFTMEPENRQPN